MGVDARIILPANVRLNAVCRVIGRALDLPTTKRPLGKDYEGSWSCEVEGIKLDITKAGGYESPHVNIIVPNKYDAYYSFEAEGGRRSLSNRSTALFISVGKRLVDFFGGRLQYRDDVDDIIIGQYTDLRVRSNAENMPGDGDPWQRFQQRIFDVEPVNNELLQWSKSKAYYDQ